MADDRLMADHRLALMADDRLALMADERLALMADDRLCLARRARRPLIRRHLSWGSCHSRRKRADHRRLHIPHEEWYVLGVMPYSANLCDRRMQTSCTDAHRPRLQE